MGQDCIYGEVCSLKNAPRAGATYCYFDSFGNCYEGDLCFHANNRPALDRTPAIRDLLEMLRGYTPLEAGIG
jgi:hypothetical protein